MDLYKQPFFLGALVCIVSGEVDGYTKTNGLRNPLLSTSHYSQVNTMAECAAKCQTEASFTCKSFLYNAMKEQCMTAAGNSKMVNDGRRISSTLYDRNVLECVNGVGKDYRGRLPVTKSGRTCQKWAANEAHKPNAQYTPENNPPGDLESNFCRNVNGDSEGPWCYTTDPSTRWEYCSLPDCAVLECVNGVGKAYRGRLAVTKSGRTCQKWAANEAHKPNAQYTPENNPPGDLESNFCRNVNGDSEGPWCYTTDPSTLWEYCSLPDCAGDAHNQ